MYQHRSDHSVVEVVLRVGALYRVTARKQQGSEKRSVQALQDPEVNERYQREVARRLSTVPQVLQAGSTEEVYRSTREALQEAAVRVLPQVDRRVSGRVRYMADSTLRELSSRQRTR